MSADNLNEMVIQGAAHEEPGQEEAMAAEGETPEQQQPMYERVDHPSFDSILDRISELCAERDNIIISYVNQAYATAGSLNEALSESSYVLTNTVGLGLALPVPLPLSST
ncbi:hypothetical protein KIPB_002212 [Kipferlia bialata]|uniref:Uncharacterized protein n=1 Tax=Kipferlia bialata TaxID=797122 RepID=A0A9K3CRW4_9EUKA|nr:hypothetical protein KIPB_002212 [Kipferlia bialata]|eukprot:g2212.t1